MVFLPPPHTTVSVISHCFVEPNTERPLTIADRSGAIPQGSLSFPTHTSEVLSKLGALLNERPRSGNRWFSSADAELFLF